MTDILMQGALEQAREDNRRLREAVEDIHRESELYEDPEAFAEKVQEILADLVGTCSDCECFRECDGECGEEDGPNWGERRRDMPTCPEHTLLPGAKAP